MTTIKEFVEARGITSLFHFTRLDNLPSILEHGLLTNSACERAAITPAINDEHRYDGADAVCATISYPNYKLFYRLRCDNPGVQWVILELESSLLWRTDCAFSNTNAGDQSVFSIPILHRKGLTALRTMFEDYSHIKRTALQIPDHYTTNPQAEVLILDGVTIDNIKSMHFQYLDPFYHYRAHYANLTFKFNPNIFLGRMDYEHWK